MMTTYLTPITRFSLSGDLTQENISFGDVILRKITDEELRQHFNISNRVLDDQGRLLNCKKHVSTLPQGADFLGELVKIELCSSTHVFVSELPVDEHRSKINDILHCWRLLRMSRVACPVTYDSASLSIHLMYPIEGRLGDRLQLDSTLLSETISLLRDIGRIPQEDLDLIDLANETGANTLTVFLLVVIAERSLMEGDENEISFKVAVYGSLLLKALDVVDARSAVSVLRKAYRVRSAFAHGGKVNHTGISDLLPSLYKYVSIIRIHTALQPDAVTSEGKKSLLFGPTNQSS